MNPRPPLLQRIELLAAVFIVVVVFAAGFWRSSSGFVSIEPGPVLPLKVDGGSHAVRADAWNATSVFYRRVSRFELVLMTMFGDPALATERPGGRAPGSVASMEASRSAALLAASGALSGVPHEATGAVVLAVDPASPAAGSLQVGDIVASIDGVAVGDASDIAAAVARAEGEPVEVRLGDGSTTTIEPVSGSVLGVVVAGAANGSSGLDGVEVAGLDGVGGPSAGLMMALAVIDAAESGDLSAGRLVAGTGTITPDGQVGGISGIELKAEAARDAGSDIFFVPVANAAELDASGFEPRALQVVHVASLDDALAALCGLAEADAPICGRPS